MSSLEHTSESNSPRHWRSLAELADAPQFRAFLEAEFPAAADPRGISRRRWLQLMGASVALAQAAVLQLYDPELEDGDHHDDDGHAG